MNVLFDGAVYQFQRAGGINRYFAELISGLPADWSPVVTGAIDFGENIPSHPRLLLPRARFNFVGRLHRRFERRQVQRLARQADLFHPTYYNLTSGLQFEDFKCPIVLTVYDMIYARFPRLMDNSEEILALQKRAVQKAHKIICISHATEGDLLELMPEARGKTTVIHLGTSLPDQLPKSVPAEEEVAFLFVGGRLGYKNFLFLLRSFSKAVSVQPQLQLFVVGAPLTSEERWQISFLGLSENVRAFTYPDEAELRSLFQRSRALLYPSRHEGFGLPALEAMAHGTIAVTSDTSSLPEITGDAAIMLDPSDENSWTDCILSLAKSPEAWNHLIERGKEQAQGFSWARCVEKHVGLYKTLTQEQTSERA